MSEVMRVGVPVATMWVSPESPRDLDDAGVIVLPGTPGLGRDGLR